MNGFLSCDWGTSSFRLRFVSDNDLKVVAEEISGEGITATFNLWKDSNKREEDRFSFYLAVLNENIKKLEQRLHVSIENVPVIISGMASSSIGMVEMPYKEIPFNAQGSDLITKKIIKTPEFSHDLLIISGARTEHDVLRGEETQLAGCAPFSNGEQLFIFPGTHSKHVLVKEGNAVAFNTYMTGEFFELLANKSILSSSLEKTIVDERSMQAFCNGVKDADSNLLHSAFMVRTNQLFNKFSKGENFYYLSGLLIGYELNDLKNKRGTDIYLVGGEELSFYYAKALEQLYTGAAVKTINADEATIKGQYKIYTSVTA